MKKHKPETVQPDPIQHIHTHTASRAGELWAKATIALAGIIGLWQGGVYLMTLIGFRRPGQALAVLIVGGGGLLLVSFLADRWLRSFFSFKLEMEREKTQQVRSRQLLQRSSVEGTGQLGDAKRLAALIIAIMMDAYDYYTQHGRFRGTERPWSRRNASQHTLYSCGDTEPAGDKLAVQAKAILTKYQVITLVRGKDEQINVKHFPNMRAVEQLVTAVPQLNPPLAQPQLESQAGNWSVIE